MDLSRVLGCLLSSVEFVGFRRKDRLLPNVEILQQQAKKMSSEWAAQALSQKTRLATRSMQHSDL